MNHAHTHNHDTEARDWAERLALEIALDMHRHGTQDACNLTAARLRLVKAEGEREGIDYATRALAGTASVGGAS